ncbi:MAG TPA: hypothetical protein DDX39_04080 [Bacteroidales bacterium]|nr:MAG: hypothetical protein A2W98_09240 [Bacteroidetes bacterium GWF2_33_38]OFY84809.1 MAG: hypothetical protein A2236_13450 [Bacteroidetes bacterium RIFOXYA2_FULL_33_7]HBF87800.1 hypothetical protein [Bacteroidales bacterium]
MSKFLIFILLFFFILFSQSILSQNKSIFISKINILGNVKTKEKIITRELTFNIGDSIQYDAINKNLSKSKENIENTLLFNSVIIDTVKLSPNNYSINITLVERWYFWPYPILEQADRNFSSWLKSNDLSRSNYGLFFQQNNFRGRNEIVKIKARFGYKEQFAINYRIPYLNKSQSIGLELLSSYFRQKEISYATVNNYPQYVSSEKYLQEYFNSKLNINYRYKLYNTFNVSLSYFNYYINDFVFTLNPDYFIHEQTLLPVNRNYFQNLIINLNYSYEKRNSIIYPLKGQYLYVDVEKNHGISNSFNQLSIQTKFKKYVKLNSVIFFASSLHLKYSLQCSNSYIYSDALGYEDNIRGFEYYVIDGQDFFIQKNNFKIKLFDKQKTLKFIKLKEFNTTYFASFVNIFFEMAYVKNIYSKPSNRFDNWYIYSIGAGIDVLTYYDKVIRLEYSHNNFKYNGFYINFTAPI